MRREDIKTLLKAVNVNIITTRNKFESYKNHFELCDTTETELNEQMKNHYKMKNWLMRQLAQAEK